MAERRLQLRFSKWLIVGAFFLVASSSRPEWPDRQPRPEQIAALHYEEVALSGRAAGVKITGAWSVSSPEPRFAGLSGLAVDRGGLLRAVTDSGVLVDMPKPGLRAVARFRDLLGGPGPATFKKYRDSEALLVLRDPRAPDTVGFEVSFENRHSVHHYSEGGWYLFHLPLAGTGWPANKGAEAMVLDGRGNQLLLGEQGRDVLVRSHGGIARQTLAGASGGIADAALLPDGRIVVAVREVGLTGLTNRLAWLEREPGGYRLRNFATLPLGALDNVEGLAAEPRPGGGAILWAVTDNDGWRRTLLLRMEIAPSP